MESLTGNIIKGYELQERIGVGGFGPVYRAYQSSVRREVAIKIILPHFADEPEFIRRFEMEAQILARLEHPHIIPLYDFWRDPDGAYLVMRYIKGRNLYDALQDGPFDVQQAIFLVDQIASALALAHHKKVMHHDLKLSNILLDEDGNAYVADFGIVKDLGKPTSSEYQDEGTQTHEYLSLEEAQNEPATSQTDIHSLGVLLYEVLTGEHPFSSPGSDERNYGLFNDPLPPITNLSPSICDAVNGVIQKATTKDPAHRYPDVMALAAAFREAVGIRFAQTPENIVETLTPREQQVLQLLAEGGTNAEIAQKLVLEISSVKWYVKQLFAKLHVASRVQAAVRARNLNLIVSHANTSSERAITIPTDQFAFKNPYKGLFAFQAADQDDFFGRETHIERLIGRLGEGGNTSAHFLAVVGPSGSGKSSLIKAGLIPRLLQGALPGSDRWFVAEMTPGDHPLEELASVLARLASKHSEDLSEQLRHDARGLLRTTQSLLPNDGSQLVLTIDQFEEVFTLTENEGERSHFLKLIYEAVTNSRSRLVVIVALRADFYDRPLQHGDFGELVRSRMETILPLAADGLERAIVEPAKRVGVTFESGLVASIVSDVNTQPGALPLLQYALTELFEHRQDHLLTRSEYIEIGGVVGALARRVDEAYRTLDSDKQKAAQQMFLRLVTLGEGTEDTRRRVPHSDLLAITSDPETMEDVIDTFAEVRLLSLDHDPVTHRPTVELAHEAILREWTWLRGWLDESRHDIQMERLLGAAADEWVQAGRDNAFLLHGSRLDQFQAWAVETPLTLSSKERDCLDASLAERERQTRLEREREAHELELAQQAAVSAQRAADAQHQAAIRLRYLVGVLSIFSLITLGLSLFAFINRNDAILQARMAFSRQLAAQAVTELQKPLGNDEYSALLAVRSLKLQYDPIADEALVEAVDRLPLKVFRGHTDEVYSVAFSPDGRYIVTASADHTARIWDIKTTKEVQTFNHSDEVHAAIFSPDGKYVLTGCSDHMARLWDVATGQLVKTFSGNTGAVWAVSFSPDGRFVLSGGEDTTGRLWDVATGDQVRIFSGHSAIVRDVAFSPDGKYVLTGSEDHTLKLWDTATGQPLHTFSGYNSDAVISVAFSPDGSLILAGSNDNTATLWRVSTGEVVRTFIGHSNSVRSVAFSPDGKYILTGSGDYTARIWDVATGQQITAFRGHTDKIWSAAFSPDGKYVLTGGIDRTVRLWDISRLGTHTFAGHQNEVHSVAVSPDGKYLLSGSADHTAILWDIATLQPVHTFTDYPAIIWSVAFSPDGKSILIAGEGGNAQLRDTATGQLLRTFSGHTDRIFSAKFSPDGKYVLTGSLDETARLWDTATGQQVRSFQPGNGVSNVAFSPDGRHILIGASSISTASLWDTATGQQTHVFKVSDEDADVWGVAFSPDGKYVLTGSTEQTAILWDATTGQQMRTFSGHKNAIYSVAFSPDGKYVLTGGADRTAILWDTATGQQLRTLSGHENAVWSVAFLPDGKHILTGSFDGTARLWDTDYHDFITTACAQLFRDFTDLEREQAHITDTNPTCP